MPRRKLIRSHEFPYHICSRVNNREPYPIPLKEVWDIFNFESYRLNKVYGAEFQSLVVMPNHFHAIVTVPEFDLGKLMSIYLSAITRKILARSKRSGHVLGGPYHRSIITSTRYYGHVFKYIYRNPVKAGICTLVEDYPYSTVYGLVGADRLQVPLCFTRVGFETNLPHHLYVQPWLDWLNTPFSSEAEKTIQKAMYKKEIRAALDRYRRPKVPELEELI
jgi:putative transposase